MSEHEVTTDVGPWAMVPMWLVEAGISARAIQTFAALQRWASYDTHEAWPARGTIAEFIGVSTDTIDRALKELVDIGALEYHTRKSAGGDSDTNLYHLRFSHPDHRPESANLRGGSRKNAATGSRKSAAGGSRKSAAQTRTSKNETQGNEGPSFDDWWEMYPRKIAKPPARRAYAKAILREKSIDAVHDGLQRWVAFWTASATEPEFIPHPATWLNQERYNDATPTPKTNGRGSFAALAAEESATA